MSLVTDSLKNRLPLYSFARARSALFTIESFMGPAVEAAVNLRRPKFSFEDPALFQAARAALEDVLRRDTENIKNGLYPLEVLQVENPFSHVKRLPKMLFEGIKIARRRRSQKANEFSDAAKDLLTETPDYYRRNFHFQGDGYLSDDSATLYDHQVDILFAGSADAMRRLILAPLRAHFSPAGGAKNISADGEGLRFLEIGSGTGRATKFVRLAFPKAKIVSLDLSAPYLKKSQENLRAFSRHDFVEGDAAKLPFQDESFDAVYSVFLFHELPRTVREEIITEGLRCLKPGGFYGLVDSLQLGDAPVFDSALKLFPVQFHEPFYRNYIETPMEELFENAHLQEVKMDTGFFSKVVTARKPKRE